MSDEALRLAQRAYADDPSDDERAERYLRELQRADADSAELAPVLGCWGVQARAYTAAEILAQLDSVAEDYDVFPMLDNGYLYPITVRLRCYRTLETWLLALEHVDVFNHEFGLDAAGLHLSLFGPGLAKKTSLQPFATGDGELFLEDEQGFLAIHPEGTELRLRGERLAISGDPARYAELGVPLALASNRVILPDVLRALLPEHREDMLWTAAEREARLREVCDPPPPELLVLDEWRHPDLAAGELPSERESFRLLADALASGDAARYAPSEAPNTHWSNWPEGGAL